MRPTDEARPDSSSWRDAYGRYQDAPRPGRAASTSATRSASPCACCASRPPPARSVQARFRYVLVDEFQDTNRAQAELVALLAERPPRT